MTIPATDPPAQMLATRSHAARGYVQVIVAAGLFGANASISKAVLDAGIAPRQLAALRCTGAAVGLFAVLAALGSLPRLRVPRQIRSRGGGVIPSWRVAWA